VPCATRRHSAAYRRYSSARVITDLAQTWRKCADEIECKQESSRTRSRTLPTRDHSNMSSLHLRPAPGAAPAGELRSHQCNGSDKSTGLSLNVLHEAEEHVACTGASMLGPPLNGIAERSRHGRSMSAA
jgi:hypothetical protein